MKHNYNIESETGKFCEKLPDILNLKTNSRKCKFYTKPFKCMSCADFSFLVVDSNKQKKFCLES